MSRCVIDRAVIGAWVGSSNLGDELIFSILLRLLKEKGVKATFVVFPRVISELVLDFDDYVKPDFLSDIAFIESENRG